MAKSCARRVKNPLPSTGHRPVNIPLRSRTPFCQANFRGFELPTNNGPTGPAETAADLRRRAARVRLLIRELANEEDRKRLQDLANELDQRAVSMEKKPDQP
jgi:hypothetical protein